MMQDDNKNGMGKGSSSTVVSTSSTVRGKDPVSTYRRRCVLFRYVKEKRPSNSPLVHIISSAEIDDE